jgi:hypothetical protein
LTDSPTPQHGGEQTLDAAEHRYRVGTHERTRTRLPAKTIPSETSELAGIWIAAASGLIFPARQRVMAMTL